jgi:hypothetical protein
MSEFVKNCLRKFKDKGEVKFVNDDSFAYGLNKYPARHSSPFKDKQWAEFKDTLLEAELEGLRLDSYEADDAIVVKYLPFNQENEIYN